MKPKCKECGQYDILPWHSSLCLRCWLKTDEPYTGPDVDENDSDPLDVCPFCGSPMSVGSDMCSSCRRERQGYADDRR